MAMFGLLTRRVLAQARPTVLTSSFATPRVALTRSFFAARILADPSARAAAADSESKPKSKPKAKAKKATSTEGKAKATTTEGKAKATAKAKPKPKPKPKAKAKPRPKKKVPEKPLYAQYKPSMGPPPSRMQSYVLFVRTVFAAGEAPGTGDSPPPATEASHGISARWHALSEAEKAKFTEEARLIDAELKEKYKQWVRDIDHPTLKIVNAYRRRRGLRTISKYSIAPKKPLASYFRFAQTARTKYVDQVPADLKATDVQIWIAHRIKEEWLILPEAEKKALKDAHDVEIAVWRQQVREAVPNIAAHK